MGGGGQPEEVYSTRGPTNALYAHSFTFSLLVLTFHFTKPSVLLALAVILFCLFVWVDALRPRSTAEVMSGLSVILSTLFLGKPPRGR